MSSRPLIPFRFKLLIGVLILGGGGLLLMSFFLRTGLRDSIGETLGASMATGAGGMTFGFDPAHLQTIERAAAGQADPVKIAELRAYLTTLRERMIREFPADWGLRESGLRHPDLMVVLPEAIDRGRVLVSTLEGEGAAYGFSPTFPAEERWTSWNYDAQPVRDARGSHFGGRAPLRHADGSPLGLLVVDADETLLRSVADPLDWGITILFVFMMGMLLAFSLALAWWLTRPVRVLDAGMARVAAGDFSVRLPDPRRRDEFDLLVNRFNTMVEGLRERETLRGDLDLASEVQRHLLPAQLPEIPGYEVAHAVLYCDQTGGDSLDCFRIEPETEASTPDRWALCVGDVSGHGIAAAMLMSWTRAMLRAHAAQAADSPERLLTMMNQHFLRDSPSGKFLTFFYAVLDPATHDLRWASAGHEPAILVQSAVARRLGSTGTPLGVLEDMPIEQGQAVAMQVGDLLLMGTDGICETRSPSGKLLGRTRIEAELIARCSEPLEAIRDAIINLAAGHRGDTPQTDDLTFLLLRRKA